MPNFDERTLRGLPLPHRANKLLDDVERLREALTQIDASLTKIEAQAKQLTDEHVVPIEERQNTLDIRMDTIVGQATEDTEILDARIDAENTIHPNLGHNIRSLHEHVLDLVNAIADEEFERQGLQRQFNELAQSQIQDELNTRDTHERIEQEAETQAQNLRSDTGSLQRQADELAKAELLDSLALNYEAEQRREGIQQANERIDAEIQIRSSGEKHLQKQVDELNHEALTSAEHDAVLQREVDELTLAGIRESLNLHETSARHKTKLTHEETARVSGDEALQVQVDKLSTASLQHSLNEQYEAEQRRKIDEALTTEAQTREEHDEELSQAIAREFFALNVEELSRTSDDKAQQEQINALAQASLKSALNLQAEKDSRKSADHEEAQARKVQGELLQSEIDDLTRASIRQNLNASRESEMRHAELTEERFTRANHEDEALKRINELAVGLARIAMTAQEISERRKRETQQEAQKRSSDDTAQQTQINSLSQALLKHILGIQIEAKKRREGFSLTQRQLDEQKEQSLYHQSEIESLIEAMLRTSLNLHDALERSRESVSVEADTRSLQVSNLQGQIQELAEAGVSNALNLQREAEQRRLALSKHEDADNYHQRQINDLIAYTITSAKNLHDAIERRREVLRQEIQSRREHDNVQQAEIDNLSTASIRGSVNLHEAQTRNAQAWKHEESMRSAQDSFLHGEITGNARANLRQFLNLAREAEHRRKLEQVVAGIKSPVDWSKAEKLAINEPRCAVVNFTGLKSMPTSKTADIPAFMEFWDMQGNYFKKPIVCSAQGSSSLGYAKKNVKFDLLNDDGSEFDLKIGNWVVQDGFHLKAYYTDFFRGVGVTSYKLWDEIMQTKPYVTEMVDAEAMTPTANGAGNISDLTLQLDTGALCHPDGFPCIVYLNGEFYGVYSWQIKKQRKNYHMDKSTVEHIHLDGTLSTANFWNGTINWSAFEIRNPNKLYTMDGKKYDGDAPRELIDETSEKYDPSDKNHIRSAKVKKYIQGFVQSFGVLKNLYSAYRTSPSEETLAAVKAKYEELFDWENMRDYLIFSDVIKNSDGFAKNWQWTTYDGKRWYVNAYDLDMSFGGHWQGTQITAPLTNHITMSTALPVYYVALLYKSELEARYSALRNSGIIDVEHIVSKLADWTARIGEGNYELEYKRWPNSPCILNYNDSLYRVRKWLEAEIANMDKVYNYKPAEAAYLEALNLEASSREEADNSEAAIRANEDASLRTVVSDLSRGAMQDRFNELTFNARRKQEILNEARTRREYDAFQDRRIQLLALAEIRRSLASQEEKTRIRAETSAEILTRTESDNNLQGQIDDLTFALIKTAINDYEARRRLKDFVDRLYQAVADTGNLTYDGTGIASTNEINEMLQDVLSDNASESQDNPEIKEMLDEVFNNGN